MNKNNHSQNPLHTKTLKSTLRIAYYRWEFLRRNKGYKDDYNTLKKTYPESLNNAVTQGKEDPYPPPNQYTSFISASLNFRCKWAITQPCPPDFTFPLEDTIAGIDNYGNAISLQDLIANCPEIDRLPFPLNPNNGYISYHHCNYAHEGQAPFTIENRELIEEHGLCLYTYLGSGLYN